MDFKWILTIGLGIFGGIILLWVSIDLTAEQLRKSGAVPTPDVDLKVAPPSTTEKVEGCIVTYFPDHYEVKCQYKHQPEAAKP